MKKGQNPRDDADLHGHGANSAVWDIHSNSGDLQTTEDASISPSGVIFRIIRHILISFDARIFSKSGHQDKMSKYIQKLLCNNYYLHP